MLGWPRQRDACTGPDQKSGGVSVHHTSWPGCLRLLDQQTNPGLTGSQGVSGRQGGQGEAPTRGLPPQLPTALSSPQPHLFPNHQLLRGRLKGGWNSSILSPHSRGMFAGGKSTHGGGLSCPCSLSWAGITPALPLPQPSPSEWDGRPGVDPPSSPPHMTSANRGAFNPPTA